MEGWRWEGGGGEEGRWEGGGEGRWEGGGEVGGAGGTGGRRLRVVA